MQSDSNADRSQRGLDVDPALPSMDSKARGAFEWSTEQLFGTAQGVGIRHKGHLYGGISKVTIADVSQSNGVIHVVDKVLLPK